MHFLIIKSIKTLNKIWMHSILISISKNINFIFLILCCFFLKQNNFIDVKKGANVPLVSYSQKSRHPSMPNPNTIYCRSWLFNYCAACKLRWCLRGLYWSNGLQIHYFSTISFSHVFRDANNDADHHLAQYSLGARNGVWLGCSPPCILSFIASDLLSRSDYWKYLFAVKKFIVYEFRRNTYPIMAKKFMLLNIKYWNYGKKIGQWENWLW